MPKWFFHLHLLHRPPDVVTLKNGSILCGEVSEMVGGVLQIKTPASPDNLLRIHGNDVFTLSVNHPTPFHLQEGSVIMGTTTVGPTGMLTVQAEPLRKPVLPTSTKIFGRPRIPPRLAVGRP